MRVSPAALLEGRELGSLVVVVALALAARSNSSAVGKDVSASGKDAQIAQIFAAWTKREKAIHNVKATIEVHVVFNPPLVSDRPHVQSQQHPQKAKQEHTQVTDVLLDLVGNRYRVDRKGGIYNASLGRVMRQEETSTFVDGKGKTYWHNPEVEGNVPQHQGVIGGRDAFTSALMVGAMQPLVSYVRPVSWLGTERRMRPEAFQILSTKRVGSSRIIECAPMTPMRGRTVRFELDSSRDYVLVRRTSGSHELTIEYGPDEGCGPVPRQSKRVSLQPDGAIAEASTTRFVNFETNVTLSDYMFEFDFPEGTIVDVVGEVRPPLTAKADGQLVPSQDIEGGSDSQWWWGRVWIVVGNAVVLVILVVIVLLRRLKWA